MNQANRKNIAIIGAGISGLRCADVLLQHGHRVTIFEARNRIGGRVAQSSIGGHEIDLGANWIHGTIDNPIYDIAQKTDTVLHDWHEVQLLWDVDGELVAADEAAEYSKLLWDDGLVSQAFAYANKNTAIIPKDVSLYDHFKTKIQDTFQHLDLAEAEKRRTTLLSATKVWGAYVGSPIERQSLKFYWLEECIEGENPFVAGTYRKILEQVSKHALAKADVHLNTRVKSVKYDDKTNTSTVIIADGAEHVFDEVVVTAPLGFLQRNKHTLLPGLAPRIDQAIDNIGYGCLDKIYVTFNEAFWRHEVPSYHINNVTRSDPEHTTPNVRAATEPIHQGTHSDAPASSPSFFHWLAPEYDTVGNPGKWDLEALDLTLLPGSTSSPTLLFYLYGPCSEHIAKMVASLPDPATRTTALVDFLQPYLSRLPHYSSANPACTPTEALATAWAGDELAGYGSYANFQVGVEAADKDVEAMRHGMPERGLWFAGEHTSPFVALGTTTGAYWSGQRVAERIVGKHS